MVLILKTSHLKNLVSKNIIKNYENIYTSFGVDDCSKSTSFKIMRKEGDQYAKLWYIGDSQYPDDLGTIWTTDDLNNSNSTFTIKCEDFFVPQYCYSSHTKLFAETVPDILSSSVVSYPDFSMDITFKSFKELQSGEIELRVMCNNKWAENASTLDDINEEKLEGKTWGLAKIIEKIDEAYYPQGRNYNQVIGVFKFRIQK